jgi:hypothetical protein
MKTRVKPAKSKQFNRFGKDFGCGEVDFSSTQTAFASGILRHSLSFGVSRSEDVHVYNFQ